MNDWTQTLALAWQLISGLDAQLLAVVRRSLMVSTQAALWAALLGVPLGAWLAVTRFRGQQVAQVLLDTMLAVPSVVVGLVVVLLFSRSGPLGFLGWLYDWPAMVLAQTVLVLPVLAALTRQVVADAHARGGEQLAAMGAGPAVRALLLAWDERYALLTLGIAGFGRAVSEVGAVMVVGGNIDGFTRVMTTAIALETSKGDLPMALALGLVLLGLVAVINGLIAALRAWREGRDGTRVVVPTLQGSA